jgi:hypothetical protein
MLGGSWKMLYRLEEAAPPCELVSVKPRGEHLLPPEIRDRILIHVVHDGDVIPPRFVFDANERPRVEPTLLEKRFIEERDWGANLVAKSVAEAMGLRGYARINVARVLLDFNRFPGSTPHDHKIRPLDRLAISPPFSGALDHTHKLELLERYYDRISEFLERELLDRTLIMIAIHTYDEHNLSRTVRPDLSLLSSMMGYHDDSRMPFGIFDPLYPDILGETTCSRILRDRISLNLERTGFRVSHNHPYQLPEGSLEVRAQVWFFFDFLRRKFQAAHPETVGDAAHELVWMMLLNTNLRLAQADALRSYLHRYRRLQPEYVERFNQARIAYEKVSAFLAGSDLVTEFRLSKERPSSLGLEVRKDLVCSFDKETGRPLPRTEEQTAKARLIGDVLAHAIKTYFDTDIHFL